jgi:hypothetical protein
MGGVKRATLLGVICTLGASVSPGALASLPTNGPDAPCLHRHYLPAFTAYSLGASFDGLPRTGMFRSCFVPNPRGKLVGPGHARLSGVRKPITEPARRKVPVGYAIFRWRSRAGPSAIATSARTASHHRRLCPPPRPTP